MNWTQAADLASAVCLLLGALLTFLAALALVRLPDLLSRMHAATKPQVLGTLLLLLGVGLRLRTLSDIGTLLLIGLFQLLTAPVAAHMIGRAAHRTGVVHEELLAVDELARDLPGVPGESEERA